MRNIKLFIIVLCIFTFMIDICMVQAKTNSKESSLVQLRAGGGSSGSGGSGGSSGSSGGHGYGGRGSSYSSSGNTFLDILNEFLSLGLFCCILFLTTILFYLKVLRSSFNSRRYLRMLSKQDNAWKYKKIEKQVIKTFYVVQRAWTSGNMESAKEYMDSDLYESFQTKLEWMEVGNKRNVLKRIRLINLRPVSIHDDEDDLKDLIWFYINGFMVDYMINTQTNEKIEGNDIFGMPFIEFWRFTRKGDKWALSKILQSNESDQIIFE